MNKPNEGSSQKTPHTDDESITTSTESDSLETWTLINDKNKKKNTDITSATENPTDTNNKIENVTIFDDSLSNEEKELHESNDSRTDDDSNVDDISEGISIISESESAGRASPLAISESFSSSNLKDYPNLENISPVSMLRLPIHIPQSASFSLQSTNVPPEEKSLRQRRTKRTSSSEKPEQIVLNTKNESIIATGMIYPLVKRGLKGLFFICASLSIIAFIGKLRNPDWKPFSNIDNMSALEQKLSDLELQNNLMRAEIDILSKQVNYLSSLSESGRKYKDDFEKYQKPNKRDFKQTGEWTMKENSKDPADLKKDILNKPFECPDGNFVESAQMCVGKNEQRIKNVDGSANVVDDIAKGKGGSAENSQNKDNRSEFQKKTKKFDVNENEDVHKNNYRNNNYKNSKERNAENNSEARKGWKQKHKQRSNAEDDEDDDDFSEEDEDFDESLEGFGKPKFSSKNSNEQRDHKTRFGDDKYKHRHQNNKFNDRSKERENRYSGSDEKFHQNGEWHERLMKQRENARRLNDFRDRNKNWFIERGDSRERMRHR